jgi:putative endonuclease
VLNPLQIVQDRWFVYIARCNDGSLYTGIALDVKLRLEAHNAGRGARYTRGRGPLALCAHRRCDSKGAALRLEWAVKQLPRPAKETLIRGRRLAAFARDLSSREPVRLQRAAG